MMFVILSRMYMLLMKIKFIFFKCIMVVKVDDKMCDELVLSRDINF